MATLPINQSIFHYTGGTMTLSEQPWKNNLRGVYKIHETNIGWLAFKPSSGFPSLTELIYDGKYLIDLSTSFDLPGANILTPPAQVVVVDTAPTEGSDNLISSGSVFLELQKLVPKEANKRLMNEAEGIKLAGLDDRLIIPTWKKFTYTSGPQEFTLDFVPFEVHPVIIWDSDGAPSPFIVPTRAEGSSIITIPTGQAELREGDEFVVNYSYSHYSPISMPQGLRHTIKVPTYAEALVHAIGGGFKELLVAEDETDNGNANAYNYNGVEGELGLIF